MRRDRSTEDRPVDEYQPAQRAIADLKAAVLMLLRRAQRPLTNAEVGQALGIYMGYGDGNAGHVFRAVLGLLEAEGLVRQTGPKGPWAIAEHHSP